MANEPELDFIWADQWLMSTWPMGDISYSSPIVVGEAYDEEGFPMDLVVRLGSPFGSTAWIRERHG